jgi:hypothetical protein
MDARRWCIAVMAGALAFSAATAQTRPRHQAWNIALGVGQGLLTPTCSSCANVDRERAFIAIARVGWTVRDRFILGVDGGVYQRQRFEGRDETVSTDYQVVTIDALFYANHRSEVFLKFGFGISHLSAMLNPGTGYRQMSMYGPAIRFGTGIDMRLGRAWALSPFVDAVVGLRGGSDVPGVTSRTSAILFGMAVTWP